MAAADIEQLAVAAKIIAIEHLLGDHRLRCRHQRRIGPARFVLLGRGGGRFAAPGGFGIAPESREFTATAAAFEHRHRIGKIGIEQLVMLDHRQRALVAGQGGAALAQCPAITRQGLDEVDRCRRCQQPRHRTRLQPGGCGQGCA